MIISGYGALTVARTDNINAFYGILVMVGLGTGEIIVPASISKSMFLLVYQILLGFEL